MTIQIFIPTAELVIPTGTQTNKANAEIETKPVTFETKISKCSTLFTYNTYMSPSIFHSLNHYGLFHLKDNFLFH